MTKEEIQRAINKKGAVARILFEECYKKNHVSFDDFNDGDYGFDDYDTLEAVVTIYSYNCTIRVMKKMLDKEAFYERLGVHERNRNRMRKDLETMQLLNYPEKYQDIMTDYEYEGTLRFA